MFYYIIGFEFVLCGVVFQSDWLARSPTDFLSASEAGVLSIGGDDSSSYKWRFTNEGLDMSSNNSDMYMDFVGSNRISPHGTLSFTVRRGRSHEMLFTFNSMLALSFWDLYDPCLVVLNHAFLSRIDERLVDVLPYSRDGSFHHWVITWSNYAQDVNVYLDGISIAVFSSTEVPTLTNATFYLMGRWQSDLTFKRIIIRDNAMNLVAAMAELINGTLSPTLQPFTGANPMSHPAYPGPSPAPIQAQSLAPSLQSETLQAPPTMTPETSRTVSLTTPAHVDATSAQAMPVVTSHNSVSSTTADASVSATIATMLALGTGIDENVVIGTSCGLVVVVIFSFLVCVYYARRRRAARQASNSGQCVGSKSAAKLSVSPSLGIYDIPPILSFQDVVVDVIAQRPQMADYDQPSAFGNSQYESVNDVLVR
jgi:hypothetical protein